MDDVSKIAIASDYAKSIRSLEECIERQQEEITRRRALLDGLKAIQYGDKIATSGLARSIEELSEQLHDMIREYVTELVEYVDRMAEARQCIACLQHPYSSALMWHYVMARPWREVERKLSFSHSRMMDIRQDALLALYEVMPLEYKAHEAV